MRAGSAGAGGFIGKTHAGTPDSLESSFDESSAGADVATEHASSAKTATDRIKLPGICADDWASDRFDSFFMQAKE